VNPTTNHKTAFTLIELLAVVVVVLILAALTAGVAGYIQRKSAIASTRAQIAAIEAALESYNGDNGYYPPTFAERLSSGGNKESSNNCILLNALCPTNPALGGKTYMRLSGSQIRTNTWTQLPNIYDGWGKPLVYYNAPTNAFSFGSGGSANTGFMRGGQVNAASYDLFSLGPDGYTFIRTNILPAFWTGANWINTNSVSDDIANWNQ
jgi:prepilin-type N-terminal cleavage/methylation domain-containing protein